MRLVKINNQRVQLQGKTNEANDEDPNVTLYNRDGTVWEPRPISKIIQDLLNPRVPVSTETELVAAPVAKATSATNNKNNQVPTSAETELVPLSVLDLMNPLSRPLPAEISVTVQSWTVVVDAASSNSHKKTRSSTST